MNERANDSVAAALSELRNVTGPMLATGSYSDFMALAAVTETSGRPQASQMIRNLAPDQERVTTMKLRVFAAVAMTLLQASPLASQEPRVPRIIDFASSSADDWFVVNDGVMGGRSSSAITDGEDDFAVFEGYVSLENNGGFASVRRQLPPAALEGASRVVLRVRGDGKRYQLRLRPDRRFGGIAFGAGFETTAGEWTTVEIPFRVFGPTFRGYRPPGVGPLDPSQIGQIGVMAADEQEGPFRLEIEWIGVDRSAVSR